MTFLFFRRFAMRLAMHFLAILSLALCWTKPVSGDGAEEIQYRHHFYDRVLGSSEPVLVEFLLNACKYCVTFRSVFDEVGAAFAANHSGFKYFKVRHVSASSFNVNGSWTLEARFPQPLTLNGCVRWPSTDPLTTR